ncbi:MAG: ATP-dependent DNA helicase RecG [Actinobacteria bacterium]|nr:ATP-dependent DNA helicase RecG [Actinomycetota bacterium]
MAGSSGDKRSPGGGAGQHPELTPAEAAFMRLGSAVTRLPGVGPAYAARLAPLGVNTVGDLVYHLPRRYLDRSNVTAIGSAAVGEEVTVVGRVSDVDSRSTRTRKSMLTVTIFDGTGYLAGVWFNQEYHKDRLAIGTQVAFSGKVEFKYNVLQMTNPSYDVLATGEADPDEKAEGIHTGRIVPLYPATAGVTSAGLRRLVMTALDAVSGMADPVHPGVLERFGLMGIEVALRETHFPGGPETLKAARRRLAFDELFIMQVGLALMKKRRETEAVGIAHGHPGELIAEFRRSLPYKLTDAQEKAWAEIAADMARPVQMNRLLEGEVGSGKTVVALLALLLAVENGTQGALMAPTEVLAYQHARRVRAMLSHLNVSVELVTGGASAAVLERIAAGEVDVVIGTHALIQERVAFRRLGLAVIDEQHRFGLAQRIVFEAKGANPDLLHMSATPIPRTLALTLFGDLDLSVIDEMPAGRQPVITVVSDPGQRSNTFAMVRRELERGRQAFVICPLVEESKKLEVKAATEEAERLSAEFPEFNTGLVHGQLKSEEKREVMQRFEGGQIDMLVSTVMVEVGVDVPNATVMIVEDADRFGLAQLHQLRGRIGRGSERAICVLFADPQTEEAKARMEAIRRYDDGFALAEADLHIRGEGQLFGTRQSGLPDLKVARLSRNLDLVRRVRRAAFELVDDDPGLSKKENELLRWETNRRFGGSLQWLFHA